MTFGFIFGKPPRVPDPNIPIFYDERTDRAIGLKINDEVEFRDGTFSVLRNKKPLSCYFNFERVSKWQPKEPNPVIVASRLAQRHGLGLIPEKKNDGKSFRWKLRK